MARRGYPRLWQFAGPHSTHAAGPVINFLHFLLEIQKKFVYIVYTKTLVPCFGAGCMCAFMALQVGVFRIPKCLNVRCEFLLLRDEPIKKVTNTK